MHRSAPYITNIAFTFSQNLGSKDCVYVGGRTGHPLEIGWRRLGRPLPVARDGRQYKPGSFPCVNNCAGRSPDLRVVELRKADRKITQRPYELTSCCEQTTNSHGYYNI